MAAQSQFFKTVRLSPSRVITSISPFYATYQNQYRNNIEASIYRMLVFGCLNKILMTNEFVNELKYPVPNIPY